MKENNAKITDFAVEYYSLLTAEPPFELNNDVPTTPEPNDNFGNKLTTIGKNYDDWNNMNTSVDEHMEMATSANGNITNRSQLMSILRAHTVHLSLASAGSAQQNKRDKCNHHA